MKRTVAVLVFEEDEALRALAPIATMEYGLGDGR
jgi:hypothetical protein